MTIRLFRKHREDEASPARNEKNEVAKMGS